MARSAELPPLVEARRHWAGVLLAAAAAHCGITDELHDLEELRASRPLTATEQARYDDLRVRKQEARRRHDEAHRRLLRLSAGGPARIAR